MRKKFIVISCFLSAVVMFTGCTTTKKNTTAQKPNGTYSAPNDNTAGTNDNTGTKAPQTQTAPNTPPSTQPVPNQQGGGTQYNTPATDQSNGTNTNGTGTNSNGSGTNKAQPNQSSTGVQYMSTIESDILTYTNQERQKAGLAPLTINTTAAKYARSKSEEMIRLNYFDHKSPVNGYISDIAQRNNWRYSYIGENIYTMNFTGQRVEDVASGQSIVQSWMNSPGHRANILNKNYTQIGIGVTYENGKVMATQIFYTP
ncbi:CAP domain-containing protein [Clostridium fungisolvens]|uniref:SCP domain-containing protein n=1 Tax=Clostridium fungisolvens TaxID=1604897 RepID=A0A6V8SL35_9CLOT|nr:CAP domain-containing protein [Clostridium fungisolvens]GFP75878.1 hypothetical protein bsdtw1_01970 [Clostridium fungisolvens]